jgi:hypothetical protein
MENVIDLSDNGRLQFTGVPAPVAVSHRRFVSATCPELGEIEG